MISSSNFYSKLTIFAGTCIVFKKTVELNLGGAVMGHSHDHRFIEEEFRELFALADQARDCVDRLLETFNERETKLFDLSAARRIFLFILTRSIKTYSSIVVLCRRGYGQDVATLLRGLLENLVTAEYILHDPKHANNLAARFVAYKWIIFKRALPEQEKMIKEAPEERQREFDRRKAVVMEHVDDFKKKFKVTSDRALITWSGKTVRDMAKHVSAELVAEYDETFRQCSKFSHPSILGDQEYMVRDSKNLIFSPQPSEIGVAVNLKQAIKYFLEFADLVNEQFDLNSKAFIDRLRQQWCGFQGNSLKSSDGLASVQSKEAIPIRDCTVVFKTNGKDRS